MKGFLVKRRTSLSLLLKELDLSVHLRKRYSCKPLSQEIGWNFAELSDISSDVELDAAMRRECPELYFKCMKVMGRDSELFDGTITPNNFTWFIYGVLHPELDSQRANGELSHKRNLKVLIGKKTNAKYTGEVNRQGQMHGRGVLIASEGRIEGTFYKGNLFGIVT